MSSTKYAFPAGRGHWSQIVLGFIQLAFLVVGYLALCVSVLRLFSAYMVPYSLAYRHPTRFELFMRCAADPFFKLSVASITFSLGLHLLTARTQPI